MILTSNGQRIRGDRIDRLIDAGLDEMNFSVAELGDDYDRVYGQPFDRVKKNILEFNEKLQRGHTKLSLSFIAHTAAKNDPKVKRNKKYWQALGLEDFKVMKFTNRAGSGEDIALSEQHFHQFMAEAAAQGVDIVYCPTPYLSFFVGPDGFYYLCCHDFSKRKSFGHVNTHTIADSYQLKENYFRSDNHICINCGAHPAHHTKLYPDEFQGPAAPQLKALSTAVKALVRRLEPISSSVCSSPSNIPFQELRDAPDDPPD